METVALDNINIPIRKGEFAAVMAKLGLARLPLCKSFYSLAPSGDDLLRCADVSNSRR